MCFDKVLLPTEISLESDGHSRKYCSTHPNLPEQHPIKLIAFQAGRLVAGCGRCVLILETRTPIVGSFGNYDRRIDYLTKKPADKLSIMGRVG